MKKIFNIIILAVLFLPIYSFAIITNVYTDPATNKTDTSVKMHGGGDTGGANDFGYFRYSPVPDNPPVFCNDIYGSEMQGTREIAINGAVSFNTTVTNLEPDTFYAYCAIVSNSATNPTEIRYGDVETFITNPCATCAQTTITTNNPLVVNGTSTYLNGVYNSTVAVKTYFEYRRVSTMSTTNGRPSPLPWIQVHMQNHNAGTSGNISKLISGLIVSTTYEYRAVADVGTTTNPIITYGSILEFTTHDTQNNVGPNNYQGNNTGAVIYQGQGNNGGGGNGGYGPYPNTPNLPESPSLTPPVDTVVHYAEGIETVFIRQITGNIAFAKAYGYQDGMNLQNFAYGLAHTFAQLFGYVHGGTREIRVTTPDVAAYQFGVKNGKLVIFEYYNGYPTGTATFTLNLKNAFGYEYYFNRKLK